MSQAFSMAETSSESPQTDKSKDVQMVSPGTLPAMYFKRGIPESKALLVWWRAHKQGITQHVALGLWVK